MSDQIDTITVRRLSPKRFSIAEELPDGREMEVVVRAAQLDLLITDLIEIRQSLGSGAFHE